MKFEESICLYLHNYENKKLLPSLKCHNLSPNTISEELSNKSSLWELCVPRCVCVEVYVNVCAQNCRIRSDTEKGVRKDASLSELQTAPPIQTQTHSPTVPENKTCHHPS
jgi:hypothetical protein